MSSKKEVGGKLTPRRRHLTYFERDEEHRYIGSEPGRTWTDQELEEKFRQYQISPKFRVIEDGK